MFHIWHNLLIIISKSFLLWSHNADLRLKMILPQCPCAGIPYSSTMHGPGFIYIETSLFRVNGSFCLFRIHQYIEMVFNFLFAYFWKLYQISLFFFYSTVYFKQDHTKQSLLAWYSLHRTTVLHWTHRNPSTSDSWVIKRCIL